MTNALIYKRIVYAMTRMEDEYKAVDVIISTIKKWFFTRTDFEKKTIPCKW